MYNYKKRTSGDRYRVVIHNCPFNVRDIPAKRKPEARDRALEFLLAINGVDYSDHKVMKIEKQTSRLIEREGEGIWRVMLQG